MSEKMEDNMSSQEHNERVPFIADPWWGDTGYHYESETGKLEITWPGAHKSENYKLPKENYDQFYKKFQDYVAEIRGEGGKSDISDFLEKLEKSE